MIISASYKTDIPAFYGDWFMRRIEEGYCKVVNSYNGKAGIVDLSAGAVDGIVFWTRNPRPFVKSLERLEHLGYPFYVQYTITGYPETVEPFVPSWQESVDTLRVLSRMFGKNSVIWRYDPILISSVTDMEFHRDNFSRIASSLKGFTSDVVISFVQLYRKTSGKLGALSAGRGIGFHDISGERKTAFAMELTSMARMNGMELALCGQRELLAEGLKDACCIDPFRMAEIAGKPVAVPSGKSHRKNCGCYEARDIGAYDTCLHGCAYCYAVSSRERALHNFGNHDPEGEFLVAPCSSGDGMHAGSVNRQCRLF